MVTSIEEYVLIDKRIDGREDENLRDRWEFGKRLLAERAGKQLLKGRLDEIATATGKSRTELKYRMLFAERYPTENEVVNALTTLKSWHAFVNPKRERGQGKTPTPRPAPKRHDRHDEVAELAAQGLSRTKISERTGIPERQVRHIVEREAVEREAEADATVIDFSTVTGKMKEREALLRKSIRREIEAEFEQRVEAEVAPQRAMMNESYATSRRIIDGRKGVLTRADYDLIRSCLHPDSRLSVSDDKLGKAFRIFNEVEILLLNESDLPTKTSSLPPTTEGLKRRYKG